MVECFFILEGEIDDRFDPWFYTNTFKKSLIELDKIPNEELGKLVVFANETWDQKSFFTNQFPYIKISEIDINTGDIKHINFVNIKEAPSRAKMIVRENDIIISKTRPHRGAISLIDESKNGFIASTGFSIIREIKSEINRKYLFFILRTKFSLNQMLQRSSGASYPAITQNELKKIRIPTPNIEIQQKLVEVMENAFEEKHKFDLEVKKILKSMDNFVFQELEIDIPKIENKFIFLVNEDEIEDR